MSAEKKPHIQICYILTSSKCRFSQVAARFHTWVFIKMNRDADYLFDLLGIFEHITSMVDDRIETESKL